jgi:rhodanese-related sulfurtransferase
LARVGYDNSLGYLDGGFENWKQAGREFDTIHSLTAESFAAHANEHHVLIVDVRKKSEYNSEHIMNAVNLPLDFINDAMASIDTNKTYYVHCAAGYRSMVFVSILRSRGYRNLINVSGGYAALKATGKFELTEFTPPVTLL